MDKLPSTTYIYCYSHQHPLYSFYHVGEAYVPTDRHQKQPHTGDNKRINLNPEQTVLSYFGLPHGGYILLIFTFLSLSSINI